MGHMDINEQVSNMKRHSHYRLGSEGNVFTGAYHSFCPRGGRVSKHTLGQGNVHGGCVERRVYTPETATSAGDTHPTGMHACYVLKRLERDLLRGGVAPFSPPLLSLARASLSPPRLRSYEPRLSNKITCTTTLQIRVHLY